MTDTEFLPSDYQIPTASTGYMKFEQGENRFRILGKPIWGNEYWVDKDGNPRDPEQPAQPGDKPVRKRMDERISPENGGTLKHFWAMVVWNYNAVNPDNTKGRLQILEITQKTIQKAIKKYSQNEKWGHPNGYDIVVDRDGEGLDTEYQVVAEPHSELENKIQEAYKTAEINLEALYDGEDPFATTDSDDDDITMEDVDEALSEK